jgi:hypothetical protein
MVFMPHEEFSIMSHELPLEVSVSAEILPFNPLVAFVRMPEHRPLP